MSAKFGEGVMCAGLSFSPAPLTVREARDLIEAVIDRLGMTATSSSMWCSYPQQDGTGGKGITLFQPITESFIVVDTWPDHTGAYLHIVSCKPFHVCSVFDVLSELEYKLLQHFNEGLSLT